MPLTRVGVEDLFIARAFTETAWPGATLFPRGKISLLSARVVRKVRLPHGPVGWIGNRGKEGRARRVRRAESPERLGPEEGSPSRHSPKRGVVPGGKGMNSSGEDVVDGGVGWGHGEEISAFDHRSRSTWNEMPPRLRDPHGAVPRRWRRNPSSRRRVLLPHPFQTLGRADPGFVRRDDAGDPGTRGTGRRPVWYRMDGQRAWGRRPVPCATGQELEGRAATGQHASDRREPMVRPRGRRPRRGQGIPGFPGAPSLGPRRPPNPCRDRIRRRPTREQGCCQSDPRAPARRPLGPHQRERLVSRARQL